MKNKKEKFPVIWLLPLIVLVIARNIDFGDIDFSSNRTTFKSILYIIIGLGAIAAIAYIWKDKNE